MKESVSSVQVLDALKDGPFREPAHSWLYEVRNGTGYNKRARYADALVVSVWPTRGVWVAGIEVKVSRSDWKRELDDPSKSAEIQKYCDYWWIAAPEGLVKLTEVPETWGLVELHGKTKVVTVRDAPKLTPEPLDRSFVASILRNQADAQNTAKQRGRDEVYQKAREECGEEAVAKLRRDLLEAQLKADRFETQLGYKTNEYDALTGRIRQFEVAAGIPEGTVGQRASGWHSHEHVGGGHYKAATLLAERPPLPLAKHFRDVADALEAVAAVTKVAS